jgi:hypothetical protein
LLEQAIAKLKTRPISEQDSLVENLPSLRDATRWRSLRSALTAIAALILEEIEDDNRWDESFARSPDLLAKLAAEAMAEHRAGKTQDLDPETL